MVDTAVETITDNTEEVMEIFDYAKQIIAAQMEVKAIQDDIKQIKKDARDEGVLVKEIDAAISQLKKEAKYMPGEARIAEEVMEKLRESDDIMDSISLLV